MVAIIYDSFCPKRQRWIPNSWGYFASEDQAIEAFEDTYGEMPGAVYNPRIAHRVEVVEGDWDEENDAFEVDESVKNFTPQFDQNPTTHSALFTVIFDIRDASSEEGWESTKFSEFDNAAAAKSEFLSSMSDRSKAVYDPQLVQAASPVPGEWQTCPNDLSVLEKLKKGDYTLPSGGLKI